MNTDAFLVTITAIVVGVTCIMAALISLISPRTCKCSNYIKELVNETSIREDVLLNKTSIHQLPCSLELPKVVYPSSCIGKWEIHKDESAEETEIDNVSPTVEDQFKPTEISTKENIEVDTDKPTTIEIPSESEVNETSPENRFQFADVINSPTTTPITTTSKKHTKQHTSRHKHTNKRKTSHTTTTTISTSFNESTTKGFLMPTVDWEVILLPNSDSDMINDTFIASSPKNNISKDDYLEYIDGTTPIEENVSNDNISNGDYLEYLDETTPIENLSHDNISIENYVEYVDETSPTKESLQNSWPPDNASSKYVDETTSMIENLEVSRLNYDISNEDSSENLDAANSTDDSYLNSWLDDDTSDNDDSEEDIDDDHRG